MGHPRTALVTGGMGGLGEAIARTLHDAGHTVLVTHSRSDEAASTWLKKEADAGYTFVSYDVDVSDWISCRRMGQRIVADGHGVDILVNNAGIHGFTKALAQEVARKGVTVNTVSPGYLATQMVMAVPEDVRNQIVAGIPVGRLGRPEEIAALVGFIASEPAGFLTGSNLSMNGGQHMR